MHKLLRPILLLLGGLALIGAGVPSRPPEGDWLTEKKSGIIEIYRCTGGDTLCGRLVWFRIDPRDPNPRGLDLKNPDLARRNTALCGLTLMYGFHRAAEPESWDGGTIYDAETGETYHATMRLQADGTLRLRGYIGVPLIGASEVWTRDTQPVPSCPTR